MKTVIVDEEIRKGLMKIKCGCNWWSPKRLPNVEGRRYP